MLRRDERLLMEAYSSINNKRDYKPVDKQFIYFPDQDAVYLNPKDVEPHWSDVLKSI